MDFGYIGKVLSPVKTNEMGYIKSSFQNVKVRPKPKTDKQDCRAGGLGF